MYIPSIPVVNYTKIYIQQNKNVIVHEPHIMNFHTSHIRISKFKNIEKNKQ